MHAGIRILDRQLCDLARAAAFLSCTCARCFVESKDAVAFEDFVDVVDFVDQAGAGIWGIPAASPQRRGGWSPWRPRKGSAEDRESRW